MMQSCAVTHGQDAKNRTLFRTTFHDTVSLLSLACGSVSVFVWRGIARRDQTPSSDSSDSGSGSRRVNDKSRSKEGKEEEAPVSDAAKDVANRLGVSVSVVPGRARRRRVPVTVCVNDVSASTSVKCVKFRVVLAQMRLRHSQ